MKVWLEVDLEKWMSWMENVHPWKTGRDKGQRDGA